ncbi:MAG: SAM-dependent methyltransferase [Ruminococcus sp.]
MEEKKSLTAVMSLFVRAFHNAVAEEPVFRDEIAGKLLSKNECRETGEYIVSGGEFFFPGQNENLKSREEILELIVNTQLAPTVLARGRYIEDCLKTAVMTGTQQYVILGAGYDSFAWRETELLKSLDVFEADQPEVQRDKLERISRAGLEIPGNLHFVPIDLSAEDLKSCLAENGFDPGKKTFFSLPGVSYYLEDRDIRRTLESISSFAAEGSMIVFDYADEGLFSTDVQRVKNMLAMAHAGGEPMKFCCDEYYLTKMLEEYGFLLYEELSPDDIEDRYFSESDISAFEHIHFASAVIKKAGYTNTKERILHTALELFSERGYDAVSVRDIAGKLYISQGALYKHYKNKRDIFDSILREMEKRDGEKAMESSLPVKSSEEDPDSYRSAEYENLRSFTLNMFSYWTQNKFAADFRKMLTLEQYRSREMSELYEQYLSAGPLKYTEDIFRGMGVNEPEKKALEFYAPVFFMMILYDRADDKRKICSQVKEHIQNFKTEV